LDSLDALSESPVVRQIAPARRLRPLMDIAPGKVGMTGFRASSGLTGAGRVLSVWDQTLRGAGVAEGRYGAELTGADQRLSRDREGHGTHVAGIVARRARRSAGSRPAPTSWS